MFTVLAVSTLPVCVYIFLLVRSEFDFGIDFTCIWCVETWASNLLLLEAGVKYLKAMPLQLSLTPVAAAAAAAEISKRSRATEAHFAVMSRCHVAMSQLPFKPKKKKGEKPKIWHEICSTVR